MIFGLKMTKALGYKKFEVEVEVFQTGYVLESTVRVKHNGLWYDCKVTKEYDRSETNFMQDFEDLCISHKLNWKPETTTIRGFEFGNKMSLDQSNKYCGLLEDKKRIEIVKSMNLGFNTTKKSMV